MRDRTEDKIILYLIRHGRTGGNEEGRYIGRTDLPLSPDGVRDMENLRDRIPQADIVFASPMIRAEESAMVLFDQLKPEEIVVIPEWREIDFGDFEMKNYKELSGDARYQEWIDSNGSMRFPEGESRDGFICRTMRGFDRFTGYCRDKIKQIGESRSNNAAGTITAVCVVHGGTIMALLSSITGGDYYDFQLKNGDGFRLTINPDGAVLGGISKVPGQSEISC